MFAKVFASLWQGSMVGRSDLQLVFIYMLANCDAKGVFNQTPEVVSALTGLPLERVEEAIRVLEAPDARSRTATDDGRRIVLLDSHRDWGWQIVNYVEYRNSRDEEQRKDQNREAARRYRERTHDDASAIVSRNDDASASVITRHHASAAVSHGQPKQKQKQREKKIEPAGSTLYAELEAEVDTSDARPVFTRLVKYLQDTGTSDPGCILAVLRHFKQNRDRIDKPLAYYDCNGPARSAIIMQHNMAIAERQQEEFKRSRFAGITHTIDELQRHDA